MVVEPESIVCVRDVAVKDPPLVVSNLPVLELLVMAIVTKLFAALLVSFSELFEEFWS